MSKVELQDIGSGFNLQTVVNNNNDFLERAFDNTLSRDGTSPNSMLAPIDMDGNPIINLGPPSSANDAVRLIDLTESLVLTGAVIPSLTGNADKVLYTDGVILGFRDSPYIRQTTGELLAGITPINFTYAPGNAKRYGALGDGLADDTTALQSWLTVCLNADTDGYLPAGTYLVGSALSLTMSGNRINQNLTLRGAGMNASVIKKIGVQTSVLQISGSAPGVGPNDCQVVIEDIMINGVDYGAHGITLNGVAGWTLRNVQTDACNYNLNLNSSLIGQVDGCILNAGRRGVVTRQASPGGTSNNTITISGNTQIKYNAEHGLDIGYASQFICTPGVNVERNGTAAAVVTISNATPAVVTFTAHNLAANFPVVFTTTGALPTGLTAGTEYYVSATGLTTNTFQVSATIGGASINTSSVGSGVHTCSPQSHQIVIRNTCDDGIGVSQVTLDGLWMELGFGGWTIYQESMVEFQLSVSNTSILTPAAGQAIKVLGARHVTLENVYSPSSGDTTNLTCEFALIKNCNLATLTDTGVTYPLYHGVKRTAGDYVFGRYEDWTATLTGVSGTVTGTIRSIKYGNLVRHIVPDLVGTSVSNAATITGMPLAYRPSVAKNLSAIVEDNNIDDANVVTVATNGVVSLQWRGAAFTASGPKGVRSGDWPSYTVA